MCNNDINIRETAEEIAGILENCGFDDVTDSSGYYVIREFDGDMERCVDIFKSTGDGTEAPHYVIYVSYEDEDFEWYFTKGLSVDELADKLEELSK